MQHNRRGRDNPDDTAPKPPFPKQHQEGVGLEAKLDPKPRYGAALYKAAGKLEGKVALITGGDSGIGRAVAYLYAREGADVAINYLPEEQADAEETKRAVESAGRACLLLPGDLSSTQVCRSLVHKTVERFGCLDILVSNAAHQNRKKDLAELSDAELDRTFKTNIYAYIWLARAALEVMADGSAIIATSSKTGLKGSPQLPDYSATKGAINAFSKALAIDLLRAAFASTSWHPVRCGRRSILPTMAFHPRRSRISEGRVRCSGPRSRKRWRPRTCSSHRMPTPRTSPASCSR